MPKQTIQVQSPIRGVDRSKGREAQPDSSVYDALNVLPYDRTGRIRAGQRAGTASLIDAATNFVVNGLYQVTLNQTETTSTGSVIHDFSFAGLTTGANLPSSFRVSNGGLFGLTTAVANAITINSGFAQVNDSLGVTNAAAIMTDAAIVVPTNHQIELSELFVNSNNVTALYSRIDKVAPSSTDFVVLELVGVTTLNLKKRIAGVNTTVATVTFSGLSNGDIVGLSLNVLDNVYTGSVVVIGGGPIVGTSTVTGTITNLTTQTGVGFRMDKTVNIGFSTEAQHFIVSTYDPTTTQPRDVRLIATSKGNVFAGTTSGFTAEHDGVLTHSKPSITDFDGHVYIVDGTNTLDFDVRGDSIGALTATAGTVPSGCRVARTWRGRLVLAAADSDPQNYFFARVGTPTDFDFSQSDAAAAFAGNDSQAGRVSDLILDMIPFTNDQLIIAGDHSLWMMRGDPADNGSVDLISNGIGIIGRDAWCIAPDGVLYFIGTGGFYRMQPGSNQPEPISTTKYDQFFTALDRSSQYYDLQWDRDHHGCNIFVTTINAGSSSLHLWYDLRTDSFWPIQYPDGHGPVSSLVYDADGPADRVLLLGGRDGVIRQVSATNRNDDGTAITSYVVLGPFKPFPGAAVLTTTQLNFGELAPADQVNPERWGVTVTLQGGVDAYSVTEGTPHVTATVDCPLERRQKFLRQRIRGGWFTVKLANSASNNYWAFESAVLDFEDGGKLREIR